MRTRSKLIVGIMVLTLAITTICFIPTSANAETTGQLMYRMYNPNSGEHFYTANAGEKDNLVNAGWKWENFGWIAAESGNPVYRVYNPVAGDHHYTMNEMEKNLLVFLAGWQDEGIGWYSTTTENEDTTPLYRLYSPSAKSGAHHYTLSAAERDMLINAGWQDEGTCWLSNYNIEVSGYKEATCCEEGTTGDVLNKRTSEVLFKGQVIPKTNNHQNVTHYDAVTEVRYLDKLRKAYCKDDGTYIGFRGEEDTKIIQHFNTYHGYNLPLNADLWTDEQIQQWFDICQNHLIYEDVPAQEVIVVVSPEYWKCNDCGKISYDNKNWQ
ncbi:MAG: hypothetical protein K5644_06350 [Lachnospiraceae bacterium]|nr:hypothetical protein [Lachnospiraceae bacterium]